MHANYGTKTHSVVLNDWESVSIAYYKVLSTKLSISKFEFYL